MSHADTYGEGGTQTQAEYEKDRKKDHPYSVLYWGSHPNEDNDDCYTGEDFDTKEAAVAFFNGEVQDPPNMPGYYRTCVAYIEIDGLEDSDLKAFGIERIRKNPNFVPEPIKDRRDDEDWRHEQAMEAGMLHGIDAYNETMGYD